MDFSTDHIPLDDEKTWELLRSGYTAGVFQCESKLVQSWLRKVKPSNFWELSAVISIVRPGPLMSGYADKYAYNKDYPDLILKTGNQIVDDIMMSTNSVICYQEQLLQLATRLAWVHLPEQEKLIKADNLRKAVGKKNQEKILEIGNEFVDGCLHNGVDKKLADELFDLIKKSGRYAFNLSHSMTYAYLAYKTAFLKANFPLQFLVVYLSYAKFKLKKWDEIFKFVNEAKIFGIEILGPNINQKNPEFFINRSDNNIIFGLSSIKYVSQNNAAFIQQLPETIDSIYKFILLSCTPYYGLQLRSNTIEALIVSGAFRDLKIPRKSLLNLFKFLQELNDKQINRLAILQKDNDDIVQNIKTIISEVKLKKSKEKFEGYLHFLNMAEYDDPAWIGNMEKVHLGVQITASSLDKKDNDHLHKCINCVEDVQLYTNLRVGVIIDKIKATKTKKGENPGKDMAIIKVHDDSSEIESLPIFPDLYENCCHLLIENNTVILDLCKKKNGWVVENLTQL